MKSNFLDRAIEYVAPVAAAKRRAARTLMAYDGASRTHRTSFKPIASTSANTEIAMSLPRLRDVCRDFGRNNPTAANIHGVIPAYTVGAGIIPSLKSDSKAQKKKVQSLIIDHLDTPAIDFDARLNLYALQSLALRTVVESGDALIVRYRPPARLRLAVPLQVRLLDADYLDALKNGPVAGGNVCFQGIEFDADGRRVAYWLYEEHPGGGVTWRMPQSKRVDARDVIHLYRQDRPGQVRGVPWGAPGVMTMWDLGDYQSAEIMRQKIAACFAVFFTGGDPGGLAQGAVSGRSDAGNPVETLEPGMIQRLPSNSTVTTASPPLMQGYPDFIKVGDRRVCIAYGVPYEVGTNDMSGVSFISGRLGRISFNLNIDQWRWHMLIPHLCVGIGNWFLEAATVPLGRAPAVTMSWTPPRREMVSPKDEIPAMRDATRAGFIPQSEQIRSLGFDPDAVRQEYADDAKANDDANLRFDSDGRFPLNTRASENITPAADDAGGNANDTGGDNPPKDQGQN